MGSWNFSRRVARFFPSTHPFFLDFSLRYLASLRTKTINMLNTMVSGIAKEEYSE